MTMLPKSKNPFDHEIRDLLRSRPVIALVGASSKPHRPSHLVMKALLDQGYLVVPVHPREESVLGQTVYAELRAIPIPFHLVDVFRRSEATPAIAREAVAIGARALWLQVGIVNEEARRIASDGGLMVVMDRCTIVEHRRLIGAAFDPPETGRTLPDWVGLCRDCRHAHAVVTPRSTFWRCGRSATDPSFLKYPSLPVLSCRGYEPLR